LFNTFGFVIKSRFGFYWPFVLECLDFFSNFVGRFCPFFGQDLAFFSKLNLETLWLCT